MHQKEIYRLVLTGLFTALAVALAYALAAFPNIELMTAVVFLAGYTLGPSSGAMVGGIAMFVYSGFNPYGPAAPPLFFTQILGMTIAGLSGGVLGVHGGKSALRTPNKAVLGAAGFFLTLAYDLLTTVGTTITVGWSTAQFFAVLALSYLIPVHIFSNTLIFAVLIPACLKTIEQSGVMHRFQQLEN